MCHYDVLLLFSIDGEFVRYVQAMGFDRVYLPQIHNYIALGSRNLTILHGWEMKITLLVLVIIHTARHESTSYDDIIWVRVDQQKE